MSQPPPIDYRTSRRPDPPGPDGVILFVAGLASGLLVSLAAWTIVFRTLAGGNVIAVALIAIVLLKVAVAIAVTMKYERGSFLAGILASMALVPLIGLGIVAALCGGFRL